MASGKHSILKVDYERVRARMYMCTLPSEVYCKMGYGNIESGININKY